MRNLLVLLLATCAFGAWGMSGQPSAGEVADASLSSNVPLKNATNTFSTNQTVNIPTLTTTSGDGLIIRNDAAATIADKVRLSPRLRLTGQAGNVPLAHGTLSNHTSNGTTITITTQAAHGIAVGASVTLAGWTWSDGGGVVNGTWTTQAGTTASVIKVNPTICPTTGTNPSVAGTIISSETDSWIIENLPATVAGTTTSTLRVGSSINGAAYTYPLTLTSAGAMTQNGTLTVSDTAGTGAGTITSISGQNLLLRSPSGQTQLGAAPTTAVTDCAVVISTNAVNQKALVLQGYDVNNYDGPALQVLRSDNVLEGAFLCDLSSGAIGWASYKNDGTTNIGSILTSAGPYMYSSGGVYWSNGDSAIGAFDIGLARSAAGVLKVTDGLTGYGNLQTGAVLTAATMTVASNAWVRSGVTKCTWTNAQVVALGAVLEGDISIITLPAKTRVLAVVLVNDTQAAGTTTLTASVGVTGAAYEDYLSDSNLKAAAGTAYKAALAMEIPSMTATTTVYAHFTSTVENLSAATTCTGTIWILTETLP